MSKQSNHFLLFSSSSADGALGRDDYRRADFELQHAGKLRSGIVHRLVSGGEHQGICDVRWKFNQKLSNSLVNNGHDKCEPLMKTESKKRVTGLSSC